MKKLIYLFILLIALTGCSTGNNADNRAEENKEVQKEQTEKVDPKVKNDVYVPNPQVTDDRNLVKIDQTISDSKGELTLKAYKKVDETLKVGPIEMIIKNVKVMHFVPDYSMIDFFHAYTHEEEFDFVKVEVEVKNTSNDLIKYTPIAALKLNSGEYKTFEDDIYLEELTGELEANGVKKGNMGFILNKAQQVSGIELLTSDAVGKEGNIIEKGQNLKIDL
ncbi:DUF4352 domain-containing protein [Bacillus sp. CECT 9360]|uniref:DUF4352 domain-containing protein n=1 Tax=Bacillus sp. CECT 9360 TaxID=2845821 RepID=UPI001E48860F|nr:DUF4352 domain-containing protein [Bacillus sp. CECT 9360]CAH0346705.1 hypothetical protein BCI9360_03050 [Bacillus sp. CECT 9360]